MKRDFDLIRTLLRGLESAPPMQSLRPPVIEGYDKATVAEHLELLIEAGLVHGQVTRASGGHSGVMIQRLTWAGHDFLQASNDESIWRKAKEHILAPAASFTFEMLKEWLKWQAKEKLGMP